MRRAHGTVHSAMDDPEAYGDCSVCGTDAFPDLLLCDGPGCTNTCHTRCHDPPFADVPAGDWFCDACECTEMALGLVREKVAKMTGALPLAIQQARLDDALTVALGKGADVDTACARLCEHISLPVAVLNDGMHSADKNKLVDGLVLWAALLLPRRVALTPLQKHAYATMQREMMARGPEAGFLLVHDLVPSAWNDRIKQLKSHGDSDACIGSIDLGVDGCASDEDDGYGSDLAADLDMADADDDDRLALARLRQTRIVPDDDPDALEAELACIVQALGDEEPADDARIRQAAGLDGGALSCADDCRRWVRAAQRDPGVAAWDEDLLAHLTDAAALC